ncbi:MAG: DUF4830 domain-containing protein [Clostridia bacterium]|nr:DUF4830 domain-containing protein [Clostridia bacterium]MBQ4131353.1 DUF4830 domain-containing protein [Clostridia bacterium]MBQ7108631.1 DUF4830 domain-containing protein [Clostridia bacterium]MBQ9919529.1 DUF4830 domain-containing protein [Clostridia bacterium]
MFGFIITKKRISNILLVLLLIIALLCLVLFKASNRVEATTLQPATDSIERIAFIENMGYRVNKEVGEEAKQIEIPYVFGDIYGEYQKLQKQAGFDLEKYAGSKATLYTYSLIFENRTDVYAHLLVANDVVIGGDISALSVENGFIKPLSPA